jgi:CxxC motif-containing protein (DUF1111 family)
MQRRHSIREPYYRVSFLGRCVQLYQPHSASTEHPTDGRAATLQDAILAHDGQGKTARDRFAGLNDHRKHQILEFLGSL